MAASRLKQTPVASTIWVQEENDHTSAAVSSELTDFGFSVGNELDWLNEKMADIFSRDAKTLTDLLKTPGKLRNKTPRTMRKIQPTPRQPLTDIFAPNLTAESPRVVLKQPQSSAPAFKIVEDTENPQPYSKPSSRSKSPQRVGQKGNIDSGYHGMTEDETDAGNRSKRTTIERPLHEEKPQEDTVRSGDDSFESAREEHHVPTIVPQLDEIAEPTQQDILYENMDLDADEDGEDAGMVQQSHRKSSFNFSSLPAREPLVAKKSLGGRNSLMERTSILPKSVRTGSGTSAISDHNEGIDGTKTTAQRLHERITLLGKAREPRISTVPASAQELAYPALPLQPAESTSIYHDNQDIHGDDELDVPSSPARHTHLKHMSVPDIAAVVRASETTAKQAQKAASLYMVDSTPSTPQKVSTVQKPSEGPLSASKFRLMSVLKSARSIFASSASASAAAKLEAHDKSPRRNVPWRDISDSSSTSATVRNMPGAMYPTLDTTAGEEQGKHEQEVAEQLKAEEDFERAREMERQKAHEDGMKREEEEAQRREQAARDAPTARAIPQPAGKLKSVGRPQRPVKDAIPKPAPVNIKVGSQLHALHDPQSRPGSSMRPSSAHSNVKSTIGTANSSRIRAAEAAARKKELEDREKQRKVQQKKELERKRIARIEEEQRAEAERKAEETRRAQEARTAAQKLAEKRAADLKKQEQVRVEQQKAEMVQRQAAQKREEDAQRARAAHELAETIARERAQQQAQSQPTGTLRQLTAKAPAQLPLNPAKPPKRQLEDEPETNRAAPEVITTYQQNEGKRRKTDEKIDDNQRASVMAPHRQPSTLRKETLTRFPNGYTAQPPATHQPSGLFKAAVSNSQQRPAPIHPSQMAQTSTARIAFADNTGPPTAMPSGHPSATDQPHFISKFKTPVRPAQAVQSTTGKSAARSSPMTFTHGDAIALPEIATDSEEEEDSEDEGGGGGAGSGFRAPSWVASPALRELLAGQQLVDPESVFGPIGELKMEEVFRGGAKNADRLKKFRDRGSSAAWIANGDAVTSAEKRRDMALRERVAREGGWRYEPGL